MPDYTPYQKKIIERYYDHKDDILLSRLGDIVTDIELADAPKKLDRLWKRAEQAMRSLKVGESDIQRIVSRRDAAELARNLRAWLSRTPKK